MANKEINYALPDEQLTPNFQHMGAPDVALIEQAVRKKWILPEQVFKILPFVAIKILANDKRSSRNRLAAGRLLALLNAQNMEADKTQGDPNAKTQEICEVIVRTRQEAKEILIAMRSEKSGGNGNGNGNGNGKNRNESGGNGNEQRLKDASPASGDDSAGAKNGA